MKIEINHIDKNGFMSIAFVDYESKKECEKAIRKKYPNGEIVWSDNTHIFVSEQYIKNKNKK